MVTPPASTHYVGSTTVSITAPADATVRELRLFDVYVRRHIDTFARLATTPIVLDEAIASQGLPMTAKDLAKSITIVDPANRQFITLDVEGTDRESTLNLADAIGTALADQIADLSAHTPDGGTLIGAQAIGSSAAEVTERALPMRALLALAAGIVAALAWVLLRFSCDDTLRTRHDLASITNAPVMATFRSGEADDRTADLLHLHLTSAAHHADRPIHLVGTTSTAAEAFDVRERLLRSFGSLRESPTHVDVLTSGRVGQIINQVGSSSVAAAQASTLVVVALRRATGSGLVDVLHVIEHTGGTVAGLIVHLPPRPWWSRWRHGRRAHA